LFPGYTPQPGPDFRFNGTGLKKPVQQGFDIQSGTADNKRDQTPTYYISNPFPGLTGKPNCIVIFIRIYDVNHVVPDPGNLGRSGFGRADVHIAVNLHGVRTDNFSAEQFGQFDPDGGFTDSGGTANDDDFGFGRWGRHCAQGLVLLKDK
jgi:hypothetical protein